MPKVSIIVPTFNRASYLQETIASILDQQFQDYEIIVTDNCSSDNTSDVILNFNDSRIHYKRNPQNFGITKNHNIALELCTGEYIHIFSDDDLMLPESLSEKVCILDNFRKVGIVHSDVITINSTNEIISDQHWFKLQWQKFAQLHSSNTYFSGKDYHKYLHRIGNLIYMPSVMLRKSILDKVGLMDTRLNFLLDWDYWLKMTLFSDVYYINKKLIAYRVHDKRVTNDMTWKKQSDEIAFIKKNLELNFHAENALKQNKIFDALQECGFYKDYNYIKALPFVLKRIFVKYNLIISIIMKVVNIIKSIVRKKIYYYKFQFRLWKAFPRTKEILISDNVEVGKFINVNISKSALKVHIGSNCYIKEFCSLTVFKNAELIIGNSVFINNYSSINCLGKIIIGEKTIIGENVKIYDHNHEYHLGKPLKIELNNFSISPIIIGKNCWIGSNVTILKGVIIGDNVIIGANNLIFKSVASNSILKAKNEFVIQTYS